jgi:hypothetical protein
MDAIAAETGVRTKKIHPGKFAGTHEYLKNVTYLISAGFQDITALDF